MVSTSGLELAVSGPSAATGQVVLRASDGESSLDTAPAGLTAIVVIAGHTLVGEIVAVRSHLERVSRLVALASSPPPPAIVSFCLFSNPCRSCLTWGSF